MAEEPGRTAELGGSAGASWAPEAGGGALPPGRVVDDLAPSWPPPSADAPLPAAVEPADLAPAPVARSPFNLHWRSLSDGLIFALVIGGPCLLATEGLHDRVGKVWVVPLVIAALGFLVAGAIAGRHRRRPGGAALQGIAVALPVAVLLVLTDLLYRLISGRPIDGHVAALLVGAIVGAVLLAIVGALCGRGLYLRRVHQRRSPGAP